MGYHPERTLTARFKAVTQNCFVNTGIRITLLRFKAVGHGAFSQLAGIDFPLAAPAKKQQ